ncbi:hypothetical protein GCM10009836_48810 [Pseudonocardia ailaonensis]|uniref:N-acetyltransferase domain-containing protein n=1 Tax=Pseudonocardia ailaonensis TaxID=367279 RepID=A0ABN2NCC0_9PSEU
MSTLTTGWEPSTPDTDSLTAAAARAMADRAAAWAVAAGGTVRHVAGLVVADALSPCVFLNTAVSVGPAGHEAARAADVGPDRACLLLTPHPTPDLRPDGLELMGHPHFMVRAAGAGAPPPPPGVTVEEVRDPAGLEEWADVLAAGFPSPASPAPSGLLGGPARFWTARLDGHAVATALSWTGRGVVDVECVATLPEYRRRGIGAAVTWAATLADPALPAVLISSDDGHPVYRGMGYLPVSRWTLWYRPARGA